MKKYVGVLLGLVAATAVVTGLCYYRAQSAQKERERAVAEAKIEYESFQADFESRMFAKTLSRHKRAEPFIQAAYGEGVCRKIETLGRELTQGLPSPALTKAREKFDKYCSQLYEVKRFLCVDKHTNWEGLGTIGYSDVERGTYETAKTWYVRFSEPVYALSYNLIEFTSLSSDTVNRIIGRKQTTAVGDEISVRLRFTSNGNIYHTACCDAWIKTASKTYRVENVYGGTYAEIGPFVIDDMIEEVGVTYAGRWDVNFANQVQFLLMGQFLVKPKAAVR